MQSFLYLERFLKANFQTLCGLKLVCFLGLEACVTCIPVLPAGPGRSVRPPCTAGGSPRGRLRGVNRRPTSAQFYLALRFLGTDCHLRLSFGSPGLATRTHGAAWGRLCGRAGWPQVRRTRSPRLGSLARGSADRRPQQLFSLCSSCPHKAAPQRGGRENVSVLLSGLC